MKLQLHFEGNNQMLCWDSRMTGLMSQSEQFPARHELRFEIWCMWQ